MEAEETAPPEDQRWACDNAGHPLIVVVVAGGYRVCYAHPKSEHHDSSGQGKVIPFASCRLLNPRAEATE